MSLAHKISAYNRKRKWKLFINEMSPDKNMPILDVGFSGIGYSPSDNFIEKHHPYPQELTALGIEIPQYFRKSYPGVNVFQYDGRIFPFEDMDTH